MTEERLKLYERAEVKINAIIDTLSQDKGGLADKLKQEDVKDFLVSLVVDCSTEATKELQEQIEELKKEIGSLKDGNQGLEIITSAREAEIFELKSNVYGLKEDNRVNEEYIEIKNSTKPKINIGIESETQEVKKIILDSKCSSTVKRNLIKIYENIGSEVFGNSKVKEVLDCSEPTATAYIKRMYEELHIVKAIEGNGKGKYIFLKS